MHVNFINLADTHFSSNGLLPVSHFPSDQALHGVHLQIQVQQGDVEKDCVSSQFPLVSYSVKF